MLVLSFEMSPDKIQIKREHETLFDALGQVGGLQAILLSVLGFVAQPLNKSKFDSYLISRLFKLA